MATGGVHESPLALHNRHGMRMAATLALPAGGPPLLAAVLLVHGFRGNREERHMRQIAHGIASRGVAALRFDMTNNLGGSDGRFADLTLSGEIDDAIDALAALAADPRVDAARVGIGGHSLGGLVAAIVAARRPVDVRSLATMSAVYDFPRRFGSWLAPDELAAWRERGYLELEPQRPETRIGYGFREDLDRNAGIAGEIARVTCPAMVLQGDGDGEVPAHNAESYRAAVAHAEMRFISGADHTYTQMAHLEQVVAEVGDWFRSTLAGGDTPRGDERGAGRVR